ncbi:MAG: glycerol-3-phosphate acyltransferase [Dehalococcoidaceae bacterium]|nr:glycerol-3-phosphate acyltransferase [Dehalococcoidaceae bacterium]
MTGSELERKYQRLLRVTNMLESVISIMGGYLLGSIPAAYIVTRFRKGVDIRAVDTGNMGAGSTMRAVGLGYGLLVAIVDIGKGSAAICIAMALGVSYPVVLVSGFAAILGHCFPFSIGFRGGQGVATALGIFMALAWQPMIAMLVLMGVVLAITRHIFSMALIAAPLLPVLLWIWRADPRLIVYSLLIIAFIVIRSRHRLPEFRFLTGPKH